MDMEGKQVVASFEDRYGDTRFIHKTPMGLRVARKEGTLVDHLNPVLSKMIGRNIHDARVRKGMTLEELCLASGLVSVTPKSRMWEIENCTRKQGIRLGTLYAIAVALHLEAYDLLPSAQSVYDEAHIEQSSVSTWRPSQ